ncbi:MAG: terminase small subunit [Pseudomonadota bacterium]
MAEQVSEDDITTLAGTSWRERRGVGRPRAYKTAEDLQEAVDSYFDWIEKTPLWELRTVGKELRRVPKMRAPTLLGLCGFIGMTTETWRQYRGKEEYSAVTTRTDELMRAWKFEGAAAELFHPNIIARDLGLSDKSEVTGKDGGPIETEDHSIRDVAKALLGVLSKADG